MDDLTITSQHVRAQAGALGGISGVANLADIDPSHLSRVLRREAGRTLSPMQCVRLHGVVGGCLEQLVADLGSDLARGVLLTWQTAGSVTLADALAAAA